MCLLRIPNSSLMSYNIMHHFKPTFCIFLKYIFTENCICCPYLPADLDLVQCSASFKISR